MAKTPRKLITEAKKAIKEVMQEGLASIAEGMISQVMKSYASLTDSRKLEAIKGLSFPGVNAYKESLLTALSVVTFEALEQARKEVPNKKKIKLAEDFDKLPIALQKKVKAQSDLLIETQLNDLQKKISFQYTSSYDSTDSAELLKKDLIDEAEDYITGSVIDGGASAVAAQFVNSARDTFFQDEGVADEIDAFEFVNLSPVSPICQDLAGKIFAKDDPNIGRYYPPLHFNCKSYVVPILKGNPKADGLEDLKPSKSELDKFVQFSESTCGCEGDKD